ncbi:MAG: hypothetical protein EP344_19575 [Bacteroidetes bacterium]|nr:MAG: hypothetical protein EP344_19575 [Bacteroidota bacterium]
MTIKIQRSTVSHALCGLFSALFFLAVFSAQAQQSTEDILQEFVESYKTDPMAMTATFGIRVGEDWWTVNCIRQQEPYKVGKSQQYTFHNYGPHQVTLQKGQPAEPGWYFRFDNRSVLDSIYTQKWTAATAASRSTMADKVAFDIEDMEGYVSSQGATATAYLILEHFWKKDAVEITRFSRDASLPVHGAAMVSLYLMKDKRIAWFSLGKDEVANGDRNLDKGQMPNLIIFTKGKGKGLFGDQEIDIEPGMSVFIGPYVKHVIYCTGDEPLEGIVVLYGDNIDYAKGQSYMDFIEKEYSFYTENEAQAQAEHNKQ